jgi:hypothetical protein
MAGAFEQRIMKQIPLVLALGLCTPPIRAADAPRPEPLPAGIATLPPVTGYWCRLPNGNWAWVEVQPQTNRPTTHHGGLPARRHWVNLTNRNRDGFRPDSVNGVKWFEDGRSYFSD